MEMELTFQLSRFHNSPQYKWKAISFHQLSIVLGRYLQYGVCHLLLTQEERIHLTDDKCTEPNVTFIIMSPQQKT